jgi:hypothetical protein
MDDSAFPTQQFTVCMCDSCRSQGSAELYEAMQRTFRQLKMEPFIEVNPIRMKNHAGRGVYITLNGEPIEQPHLEAIYKSLGGKRTNPATDETQEW